MSIADFVSWGPLDFGVPVGRVLTGLPGAAVGFMFAPTALGDGTLDPRLRHYQWPVDPTSAPQGMWDPPLSQLLQQSYMTWPRDVSVAPLARLDPDLMVMSPGAVEVPSPDVLPAEEGMLPPMRLSIPGLDHLAGADLPPFPWHAPGALDFPVTDIAAAAETLGKAWGLRPFPLSAPPPALPLPRLTIGFRRTSVGVAMVPSFRQGRTAPPERPRRSERKVNDPRTRFVVRGLYRALRGFGAVTELQDLVEAVVWNAYVKGSTRSAMGAVRGAAWRGVDQSGSPEWLGARINARSYGLVFEGLLRGDFVIDGEGVVASLVTNHYMDRAIGKVRRVHSKALDRATGDRRRVWASDPTTLLGGLLRG